jgi:acyl-CoA hydrolase
MNIIFGGKFLCELDIAAASAVRQVLRYSECDSAVTYKITNLTFLGPSYNGDTIHIEATIKEVRERAIVISVRAFREPKNQKGEPIFEMVCTSEFVFISTKDGKPHPHGIPTKLNQ